SPPGSLLLSLLLFLLVRPPHQPTPILFPYTTLFRSTEASRRRHRSVCSRAVTSVAARCPDRIAPFMVPDVSSAVSVPAQCTRPTGSCRNRPKVVHVFGATAGFGPPGAQVSLPQEKSV